MNQLITTLGNFSANQLGMILPHEHIFVDLGPIEEENWKNAKPYEVIMLMAPELQRAREAGVTALVECTPMGVGRRVDIVQAVSESAGFPVIVATGLYREPWIPLWAHKASQVEIQDWMIAELTERINESGVKAGWIKLSAGDNGLTPTETKILQAATQASIQTGAVNGSHTIKGSVVQNQLDIIEEEGGNPTRFIWIHTQAEPDFKIHLAVARRGAWLEYDSIGSGDEGDQTILEDVLHLLDAGFESQLMLSHDRGWYDPSKPGGGIPRPFDFISKHFLPRLRSAGVSEEIITRLTATNPFNAFSRPSV